MVKLKKNTFMNSEIDPTPWNFGYGGVKQTEGNYQESKERGREIERKMCDSRSNPPFCFASNAYY